MILECRTTNNVYYYYVPVLKIEDYGLIKKNKTPCYRLRIYADNIFFYDCGEPTEISLTDFIKYTDITSNYKLMDSDELKKFTKNTCLHCKNCNTIFCTYIDKDGRCFNFKEKRFFYKVKSIFNKK